MKRPRGSLNILHLLLSMGETSAPYNEHCLASSGKNNIAICTLLKSEITPPEKLTLFEGDASVIGFLRVLRAALDAKEYDIVHAHSPHVGFLFLVGRMLWPGKSMPATVFTVHSSYPNYKLRNRLLLVPVFAFFEKVVCCSKASYESFSALYRWLAGDRLCYVQNGLDIDRIDRVSGNQRGYAKTGAFTIVTVGRLIELKNPLCILKAFQESADQGGRLVYIGEGPLRDNLLKELEARGLGKQVELPGLIPRDRVYEELTQADLFVSASQVEGLPVAVLEAMACRCPAILSDIPPHREIVNGADFVPLIHPDDVMGFAREIRRFRQMTSVERAEIGEKGRRLVEDRFSLTTMHRGYEEVYAQLLDKHGVGSPWSIHRCRLS